MNENVYGQERRVIQVKYLDVQWNLVQSIFRDAWEALYSSVQSAVTWAAVQKVCFGVTYRSSVYVSVEFAVYLEWCNVMILVWYGVVWYIVMWCIRVHCSALWHSLMRYIVV